jgi:hypothetical protein
MANPKRPSPIRVLAEIDLPVKKEKDFRSMSTFRKLEMLVLLGLFLFFLLSGILECREIMWN